MPGRISFPRVRYSCETDYSNRPGYHDVQYEMIFMSDQNLLLNDSVREAVMCFSSDVYYLEAFVADYVHRLSDSVMGVEPASGDSRINDCSDSSRVSDLSSGIYWHFGYLVDQGTYYMYKPFSF